MALEKRKPESTVHGHRAYTRPAVANRQELLNQAVVIINHQVGLYLKEHGKDEDWATRVRVYYMSLLTGKPTPAALRLKDDETKTLVQEWVNKAREATGLPLPNRATKKKPRRR